MLVNPLSLFESVEEKELATDTSSELPVFGAQKPHLPLPVVKCRTHQKIFSVTEAYDVDNHEK